MADEKRNEEGPRLLTADERRKAIVASDKEAAKAEYKPVTAQEALAAVGPIQTDDEERARKAGVTHPAYIDYAEALKNYESREDVEPLAQRRAREVGSEFSDADFRREIASVDHTGLGSTDTAVTAGKDSNVKDETKKEKTRTEQR